MSFAKNMRNNIGKNINKNLISKYSQKILDQAKWSTTVALKTASKKNDSKNSRNNQCFNWK